MLSTVITEFEHDSINDARDAALDDAASSGGRVFPCTVFKQGGRVMISTAFPAAFLERHVKVDSASKGASSQNAYNRPLIPDHVRTIREYLLQNRQDYILPPVALNVPQMPQVHVQRTNAATRSGFLVVGDSTYYYITDGQHRIAAIRQVLEQDASFANEALCVQIVIEGDIHRIHQDFADAAQTKQIPASLLAAYNRREPINRVLLDIVEQSPLLKKRIDETSKTLPKFSQSLFLLNQVRGCVKELLVGDYAISDDSLMRNTAKRLATKEQQAAFVAEALRLFNVLTEDMEPWNRIVDLPVDGSEANQIPDFRKDYLNMTATGLVILGRVAFNINKISGADRIPKYRELASRIDWRRDSEMWRGNVVTEEGKLVTSRSPVALAAYTVMDALHVPYTRVAPKMRTVAA